MNKFPFFTFNVSDLLQAGSEGLAGATAAAVTFPLDCLLTRQKTASVVARDDLDQRNNIVSSLYYLSRSLSTRQEELGLTLAGTLFKLKRDLQKCKRSKLVLLQALLLKVLSVYIRSFLNSYAYERLFRTRFEKGISREILRLVLAAYILTLVNHLITAPIDTIATNIQVFLQDISTVARNIRGKHGYAGFFGGLRASMVLSIHPLIDFFLYDSFTRAFMEIDLRDKKASLMALRRHADRWQKTSSTYPWVWLVMKLVSTLLMYPFILSKAILQVQYGYKLFKGHPRRPYDRQQLAGITEQFSEAPGEPLFKGIRADSSFDSVMLKVASFCLSDTTDLHVPSIIDTFTALKAFSNRETMSHSSFASLENDLSTEERSLMGIFASGYLRYGTGGLYRGLRLQIMKVLIGGIAFQMIKKRIKF